MLHKHGDFFFRKLNALWLLDQFDQRALLSYILLFDYDSHSNLTNLLDLEDVTLMNEMMFQNHVEKLDDRLNIQTFVATILELSIFFSSHLEGKSFFAFM
jgi:hypothetical protein